MGKYNTKTASSASSPLASSYSPAARTATGGQGFVSDAKSELFRLGVNGLLGNEQTFHETAGSRDKRMESLSAQVALEDPAWIAGFLPWLRGPGANIRTASLIGAGGAIHARLSDKDAVREDELLSSVGHRGVNRYLADQVCQRADEPTEFAQMYIKKYGSLPKPVKRGLADAANRLWNPYSTMKYDTASHGMRFGDLMNLAHISPVTGYDASASIFEGMSEQGIADYNTGLLTDKSALFTHIVNRRYGNEEDFGSLPKMIQENISLRKDVANGDVSALLNPDRLRAAGMTWEDALSLAGPKVDKGKLWDSLILAGMVPIFATLRNLRNFSEAKLSQEAKEHVHKQLANEKTIQKSRILPFRFLTALEAQDSYEWHSDLETAVQLATRNVPKLDGKTIVLVDTSGSMDVPVSNGSKMTRSGIAAFMGGSFAAHNAEDVALYIYADGIKRIDVKKGSSVLKLAEEMHRLTGTVGHGTQTGLAMRQAIYENPDARRLIDNTDMQSFSHGRGTVRGYGYGYSSNYTDWNGRQFSSGFSREGVGHEVPDKMHLYSFDLAGYKLTNVQSHDGSRTHQLSGMAGDPMFNWMKAIEAGNNAKWPWLPSGK